MNYWQFKFNMKDGEWKEFETISSGEKFAQSVTRNRFKNCIGDIVFYYRTDNDRGIYFISQIISEPYQEEYNTGYAIDLKIIKKLEPFYNDMNNEYYSKSQLHINSLGQGGTKYFYTSDDKPNELYKLFMDTDIYQSKSTQDISINDNDLDEVNKIKTEYIADGYLFNAFNNLNIVRGEVKHLAFIGNLLDPYGSHFKDDLFLRYFIQNLCNYESLSTNNYLQTFIDKTPIVEVEKVIKDTSGKYIGRIDLWLENDDYIIAIEGKIEAKDNKGQLEKYNEYLTNQDKEFILLYLTLRGEKPENIDENELYNFHRISFENDILGLIEYAIDDENIVDNINNTLLDYQDAVITYLYKFHLSFKYSYALIQEITKDKVTFLKYQKVKEYYYQNQSKLKNTVIEDIAENFEYAKANIEKLFFQTLVGKLNEINNIETDDENIQYLIYIIAKERKNRLLAQGAVEWTYSDKVIFTNSSNGFYINEEVILNSSYFKSENIAKLLDNEYMDELTQKIILSI